MKKLFVLSLAVLFVAAFTLPVMAAEWSFYGSSRMMFWSNDVDTGVPGAGSDRDTNYQGQSNSRIGAKVTGGNIRGYLEVGHQNNGQVGSNNLYTRKLYGTWKFGAGLIKVGKDYVYNVSGAKSTQLGGSSDASLCGYGHAYQGRRNYMAVEIGGLDLALVESGSGGTMPVNAITASAAAYAAAQGFVWSGDYQVPMINARYTHKINNFTLQVAGNYLSYDLEAAGRPDASIDCYSIEGGVSATFGPLRVGGEIYYAQNNEQLGYSGTSSRDGYGIDVFGNVIDNDTIGWSLVADYVLNDMLKFQIGYGTVDHEYDSANAEADDFETYYLNATIVVTKGFYIVPEIGMKDYKTTGTMDKTVAASTDEGDVFYVGAKFQMDF